MKILLVCSAGMSTSLLVNKMLKISGGKDIVEAYSISDAIKKAENFDVILLGPQVRYQLNALKKQLPHKIIAAIDMQAYGRMDGEKVLQSAYGLYENRQNIF